MLCAREKEEGLKKCGKLRREQETPEESDAS